VARWRYAGPGPQDDGQGGIVRPGEERDFDQEPAWGPWEPVPDGDGGAVSDSAASGAVPPAPAPVSPAAGSVAPPAASSAPAPFGTETSPEGS
jgi:hypothetical protein